MASNNKMAKVDVSDNDAKLLEIIESIDDVQNEIDMINEKASDEILIVEQKFNLLRKPHYAKRNELIAKIPDFWSRAFVNHPALSTMLTEKDAKIIQYLRSIEVQEFEDIKSGFKIVFSFDTNPIFSNKSLTKTFNTSPEIGQVVKGTKVEWIKDDKKESKKEGNKRGKEEEEEESFFEWFEDDSDASNDEIAELIKEDLWSNPMNFYMGNDMDDEDFDEDEDELEDEEEETEDDE